MGNEFLLGEFQRIEESAHRDRCWQRVHRLSVQGSDPLLPVACDSLSQLIGNDVVRAPVNIHTFFKRTAHRTSLTTEGCRANSTVDRSTREILVALRDQSHRRGLGTPKVFRSTGGGYTENRRAIIHAMKLLRTVILLLLCAVLPISGLAASGLTGECPMQHTMSMDTDSGMSADMPDCDMMKSQSVGKAKAKGVFCKVTAQCQFGSLYHPVARTDVSHPAALVRPVVFHYADSLPVRDPNGLWRPPRLS